MLATEHRRRCISSSPGVAQEVADTAEYGLGQCLYVGNKYVPDGRGMTYNCLPVRQCPNRSLVDSYHLAGRTFLCNQALWSATMWVRF